MKSILKTLKLLTDPTRLRIINVLDEESLSVAELQEILGMGQSRISTQLAQLRQEGLVEDTRSGKNVFYTLSLADDLHNVALKACGELPEAEADKKALRSFWTSVETVRRPILTKWCAAWERITPQAVHGRRWPGRCSAS